MGFWCRLPLMSEMVLVEEEEKPLTLKEVLCPPEGKQGPWIESQEARLALGVPQRSMGSSVESRSG